MFERWRILLFICGKNSKNIISNKKVRNADKRKNILFKSLSLKFEGGFANYIGSHYYADVTLCFLSWAFLQLFQKIKQFGSDQSQVD